MSSKRLHSAAFRWTLRLATGAALVFLLLPIGVIIAASFGQDSYLRFPPRGFTLSWYEEMTKLTQFGGPLLVSLQLGAGVAVTVSVLGALAAYALDRIGGTRGRVAEGILMAPVLLPSLVIGLGLLVFFNVLDIRNAWLTLGFGHVVVTLPFVLQTAGALVQSVNPRLEQAAMTLGARPMTVVRCIVLPLLLPGILAGGIIGFALSFDEFVVSVLLAQGGTSTFPVQLFQFMRFSVSPTIAAISTVLIIATALVILLFHRIAGVEVLFGLRRTRSRD